MQGKLLAINLVLDMYYYYAVCQFSSILVSTKLSMTYLSYSDNGWRAEC